MTEISLKEVDKKMEYKAGQFAFFSFQSKYITDEIHPFSFVSNPKDELIKIIAKRSGDYTERLHQLNPDTLVKVEGPYGAFGKYSKRNKQLWIAGGIGITPFLSMLKEISNKEITLIHVVSVKEHLIYQKEIKESGIKYIPYISKKEGRIDVEKIMKLSPIKDLDILMCGPLPMMKDLKKQFRKQGVSGDHIFFEDFALK
jgi:predicted ferric reductase